MKKVLIVDDDEGNVKFLSTLLKENGYEPVSALHGAEGLDKAKSEKPALILLDIMMPKKSGFVLFNQLKKDEALKDIPVIMLTAVAETIYSDDSGDAGAFSEIKDSFIPKLKEKVQQYRGEGQVKPEIFLDKPIEPDVLIRHVNDLIGPADKVGPV
ncbi:MAG: response regulator [bacterium]